ncbi:MAG: DNA-methyltransferase [Gammaproteobacteria bacterium]
MRIATDLRDSCLVGDCRTVLKQLIEEGLKVQMCVTSPPYWGLRDYGCEGQIGLERTPDEYVAVLVEVFRLVRDLLADDGTLWLNLGDCYATGAGMVGQCPGGGIQGERWKALRPSLPQDCSGQGYRGTHTAHNSGKNAYALGEGGFTQPNRLPLPGLKPKDLVGIPWREAFALQADSWTLRSDIIWHKPNPMPESVRDRPTRAHEYLFLLSKSERYYYDAEAIRELCDGAIGHNRRSVWTIATESNSDPHFATFPQKLIEPCVLAGSLVIGAHEPEDMILTPTGDGERHDDPSLITGRAGMNRPRRAIESTRAMSRAEQAAYAEQLRASTHRSEMMDEAGGETTFAHYLRTDRNGARVIPPVLLTRWIDRGWLNRIEIAPRTAAPHRSTVLDPFLGSGTTAEVAQRLRRRWLGIDLNPGYTAMQQRRTAQRTLALQRQTGELR